MNPLTLAVSKVIVNENPNCTATGFFYKYNNITYFVTNKHVVQNADQNGDWFDSIKIFPNRTIGEARWLSGESVLIGKEELKRKCQFHVNQTVDICVIPTDYRDVECINRMPQTDLVCELSDDVFIIGYPHGHNSESGKLSGSPKPIWKRGTIATEMSLEWDECKLGSFLIDATGQRGNSGSPVVSYIRAGSGVFKTQDGSMIMQSGGFTYRLLGIMSAGLHMRGISVQQSDLIVVWRESLIENIIINNRK